MSFASPAPYRLCFEIGAGTTFVVAVVETEDRRVICKRLRPSLRAEGTARDALVREAQLLRLAHDARVTPNVIDVGTDAGGPYVLQSWIEGWSLRRLGQAWRDRGPPPPGRLLDIARTAFAALTRLHQAADALGSLQLVHGDITPDHAIVDPSGSISFIDLGAGHARGIAGPAHPTGTLPYMSPEIARGERAAPRPDDDWYALGSALLYAAHGEPLLPTETEAERLMIVAEQGLPDALFETPGLPDALRQPLRDLLAHEPSRRERGREVLAKLTAA